MEYTTVLLLLAILVSLLWIGGVLWGVVVIWRRRQRWVAVFEGEYREAKKIEAVLESSGIPSEISPSSGAGVILRVLGQYEGEARKLIGSSQE
jgi:uncharacterized membrane protein